MSKQNTNLNILVIEDNPGDFLLIHEYLEEQQVTENIIHAKNFQEAESRLSSFAIQFDVILLDLSLPDRGGEQLITDIVSLSAGAVVIVLTGYENIDFSIKSLSLGVADYLVKDDINATSLYKSILYNIERKKTNLKLEESEKRYSNLFHLSPQPMWVYDLNTLRFLDVNQVAINEYGYTKEEFAGMTIKDIRPSEDIPLLEAALARIHQKEGFTSQGIYRHQKKSGEIIKVDLRACVMYFNDVKSEIIVANNITTTASYIEAIQEQNEKLREIAWVQSHIVRAPLARVMALTELLRNNMIEPQEKEEILQFLIDSSKELDEIIKDISSKTQEANVMMKI